MADAMKSLPRPVARSLIVCEQVRPDAENPKRVSLLRLMTTVRPVGRDRYPVVVPELSVFALLSECRGAGRLRVEVAAAVDGAVIIRSPDQHMTAGNNPLAVHGAVFRFYDRAFPAPGLYMVQLLYNDGVLIETPLVFSPPAHRGVDNGR